MQSRRKRAKVSGLQLKSKFGLEAERLLGNRRRPKSICVMFHGYTGTGDDGVEDALRFARALPSTLFVLPSAVSADWVPYDGKYSCRRRGSFRRMVVRAWRRRIGQVTKYLDYLVARYPSVDMQRDVVLVGYSQGAGVASYTGLRLKAKGSRRVRGIVSLGGVGCPRQELLPKSAAGTGICFINGTKDGWAKPGPLRASFRRYGATMHWLKGVGHFDTDADCEKMAAVCGAQLKAWLGAST